MVKVSKLYESMRSRLHGRRHYYQAFFETDAGKFVLAELYTLCHAGRTTFEGDKERMLVNEGKRQVWLHIRAMLNASDTDLENLARQHLREQNQS